MQLGLASRSYFSYHSSIEIIRLNALKCWYESDG